MRFPIEQIGEEGLDLVFESEPREFPVLEEIRSRGDAAFERPVRFEIRAVRAGESVDVRGRLETRIRLRCSRCLADFDADLADRFALTYSPRYLMPEQLRPGEEAEISADEIGLIPFDGAEIDLREGLQEQLVMAIPCKPLCREDCKGLCPHCGADLNRNPCRCGTGAVDPRLAPLAGIKLDP
ncbi:MAG: DUF177 domain-containing protein [Desulfobacterales bacterium]|jgi:uncharacterized protein